MRDNHGRGSGLALLLLLAAALLVAWLVMEQRSGLGGTEGEDRVQRAEEVVQSINDRTQNAVRQAQEDQGQSMIDP